MNERINKMILESIAQGMKPPFVLISRIPISIIQFKAFISENKVLNVPDGNLYLPEKRNVNRKLIKALQLRA